MRPYSVIYPDRFHQEADRLGGEAELTFELWRRWGAEYVDGATGERIAAGPPVSPSASTVCQEEAATESGHDLRFPASSYRARRRWVGWGGALIVSALLWALLIAVARFIAQQA